MDIRCADIDALGSQAPVESGSETPVPRGNFEDYGVATVLRSKIQDLLFNTCGHRIQKFLGVDLKDLGTNAIPSLGDVRRQIPFLPRQSIVHFIHFFKGRFAPELASQKSIQQF